MNKIIFALLISMMMVGCRFITSFSEINTRQATSPDAVKNECKLALSSGTFCQMSQASCSRALAVMTEIKTRPRNAQSNILSDSFVQNATQATSTSLDKCDAKLENWVLSSFASGKRAPYNVAGLVIPGLQEIKLLIWGGGMMAGFMGNGMGSACMSAVGAGISYAESKKWIECGR
jgi:hypothetical protein